MALNKKTPLERCLNHALLLLGCALFAFPFLWMLMTSFKVPTEMDLERLRLLPRAPRPQVLTPYIDPTAFTADEKPDEVPDAVWNVARARLIERIETKLAAWRPHLVKATADEVPLLTDMTKYREVMVGGLLVNLQQRLSDECRRRALELARARRPHTPEGDAETVSDEALIAQLDQETIEAAVEAILSEAETLVDDAMLAQVFSACYRRFCLSAPRVRTTDYQVHDLGNDPQWRVERGTAEMVARHDGSTLAQEARIDFSQTQTAILVCTPPVEGVDLTKIDRIFIRFRADSTWARVALEVVHDGKTYQTQERISLSDREWIEQELRFPGGEGGPLERRTYRMLHPTGDAPSGSPAFLVRLQITRNTWWHAWCDKLINNYGYVFREVPYARYMMTSLSLVILNIVLAIISCTLVGYSFARLQWPGREFCFALLLATMMLPAQVTMIPSFLIIKSLGWFNTLLPLWVPSAFGAPFFIFLFRQFFKNIPVDLEDAACIDGCGFLRIYWHVMLPLVKPTIATVAIFTFMGTWNNFMGPLIYLNNEYFYPLALGLFKFNLRNGGDIGLMMAGALVMTLPIITLFFFVQRFFIQGISLSGTKA
jgi:ABC-type glycerol-3-phosphate transport system permease component